MSEQFENSIRKKLEEVDIPFDPAAWDKMKKRLDDSDRRRPVFWWWTSGFLLLLLLAGGGWWWYAQQDQSTAALQNVPIEKTTASGSGENDVNKPIIAETEKAEKITPPSEEINSTTPSSDKLNAGNKLTPTGKTPDKSTSTEKTHGQTTPTEKIFNQTTPIEKTANSTPSENTFPSKNQTSKNKTSANEPITADNNSTSSENTSPAKDQTSENKTSANEPTTADNGSTPQRYNIQPIPFLQLPKIFIPATVNNSPVINIRTDTTSNSYTKKIKKRKSGFEGGITLGPDYNIAPSFKMGKLGFNGGLLLRYHVNNRLSLSVAAVYAKKVYGATPRDYKFTYPTNYVKIEADCNVLDVPLNVHYKFLDRPKFSWSAMAGASSYFMLKEKYDYYWANNNKRTREFSNQNQHYFSVLNLGVTYERKTAGRLKWGLQPYVKVPMAGVGEGKVKLSSAGVSLQLTLGKKD